MHDPARRLALVTGVSRGLGLTLCSRLLEAGYAVVGVSRGPSPELAELALRYPEDCFLEPFDLEDIQAIPAFCLRLHTKYGRFYALIKNAGIGLDGILATMHDSAILQVLNVNLVAPILLCKYVGRAMLPNRSGRIINVASIIATTGYSGLSVYAASKAGVIGLTKSLARELGKAGITVNSVSPGYLQTSMTKSLSADKLESIRKRSPFNRFPLTAEVAHAVLFLLSDEGSGIHGTNIVVDAGSTA